MLTRAFYLLFEQMQTFKNYWGDWPSDHTISIFWLRAKHDAQRGR